MARIRTIKPEFFTSEDIVSLTPLSRLFYVALWCEADRDGRLQWKPRTLKMRYLPADDCDIEAMAKELTSSGLVVLYEVDGKTYAEIPTFCQHQVINNREADSVLPARVNDASVTRESGRKEGRERKGKEGKGTGVDDADGFDEFWDAYPKKSAKQDALKAWRKVKAEEVAAVMAGLAVAKASKDWLKDGGQFIPHPATWLYGRRWEDEGATAPATTAASGILIDAYPQSQGITTEITFAKGERYTHHYNGTHYWNRDKTDTVQPQHLIERDGLQWSASDGWRVAA